MRTSGTSLLALGLLVSTGVVFGLACSSTTGGTTTDPSATSTGTSPTGTTTATGSGTTPTPGKNATYYVAPSGDDAADGSEAKPWKTLQRAAEAAGAGDTVVARPGEYAGFNVEDKNGTDAARIVFRGEAGAKVTTPGPTAKKPPINTAVRDFVWARWPHGITVQRSSYVTIEGFEVSGMPGEERDGAKLLHRGGAGIRLEATRHVTVRKNNSHDNGRWAIFGGFTDDTVVEENTAAGSKIEHGIYLSNSGDRSTIRKNKVFGNAASGIQLNADNNFDSEEYKAFAMVDGVSTGVLIAENEITDNGRAGGAAVNLDGVSDSVVRDNVLTNNHATGIALFQENGATGSQRNQITGNKIDMASDGRWAIVMVGCEDVTGGTCNTASEPPLPAWVRPAAPASGSTGNVITKNEILTKSAVNGSIRIDTRSLAADTKAGAPFTSNENTVVDRFGVDAQTLTLAAWRTRTGQDMASRLP